MLTAAKAQRTAEPCRWPDIESVGENLRELYRVMNTARDVAEKAAGDAAVKIRRHPFRYVGGALAAGVVAGALAGFGAAWCARRRW